ncbi:MAG: hypothetical protein ACKOSR_07390 [Flavobacteriales bacterium]
MSDNSKGLLAGILAFLGNLLVVWVIFYLLYKLFTSSNAGVRLLKWILMFFFVVNMYLKYR